MSDDDSTLVETEDFRDFCKFVSQTHDEFIRAEDDEGEEGE